jgi:hypothetical protein
LYTGKLTVSGKDSSDAKTYQEKDVQKAIKSGSANLLNNGAFIKV